MSTRRTRHPSVASGRTVMAPSGADYSHWPSTRKGHCPQAGWSCADWPRRHHGRPQSAIILLGHVAFLMPLSSSAEPALPAAWNDVLDQIQRALAETLRATEQRPQALESTPIDETSRARSVSEGLSESLADASGSADESEKRTAETERTLAGAQEALDRWLAMAAQVGQRLADLAARAV